jgi:23S rRNA (cytosine1962-C5)-methyltransferase
LRRQSLSGRALDAFSYSGGFSLAAGFAGAESVVAVDASQEALGQLAANAELNGFQDRIMTVRENVFVYLKAAVNRKEKFSTVILDPPSFTRSAGEREDALRGYRELHRRAAQLLLPGGLLLSCSCSHHVSREEFRKIALSGVDNTGHRLEIISLFGPDGDHPEVSQVPESRYLTCLLGKLK